MSTSSDKFPGSASISLGQGAEFYITPDQVMGIRKLHMGHVVQDIELGTAHEKSLENILTHIASMRVFTIRSWGEDPRRR